VELSKDVKTLLPITSEITEGVVFPYVTGGEILLKTLSPTWELSLKDSALRGLIIMETTAQKIASGRTELSKHRILE
jgi:hypothetical protein